MDHTKIEESAVQKAMVEANQEKINELNDLQLTLVGGGFGETIL